MADRSPAFQFYPRDFMADENVLLMSLEERGAYIWLMSICWLEGSIPADTRRIGRLLGLPEERVSQMWDVLGPCFRPDDERSGRLVHPRLEKEREKQSEWKAKSARGGRAAQEAKRQARAEGGSRVVAPTPTTLQAAPLEPRADIAVFSLQSSSSKTDGAAPAKGRQLPDDWKPNDGHRTMADQLGVSIRDELPQFKDHHRSKGSVMKDWDAAFRTWLRNAKRFQKNTPPPASEAGRVLSVRSDDVARQREKRAREADAGMEDVSRWIAEHRDVAERERAACFDGVADGDLAGRALAMAAYQKRIRELMEAA